MQSIATSRTRSQARRIVSRDTTGCGTITVEPADDGDGGDGGDGGGEDTETLFASGAALFFGIALLAYLLSRPDTMQNRQ